MVRLTTALVAVALAVAACGQQSPGQPASPTTSATPTASPPAAAPAPATTPAAPTPATPAPPPQTPAPPPQTPAAVTVETVVNGLDAPSFATAPAGEPGRGRLFVTEQRGTVRIVEFGPGGARVLPRPFLDIARLVRSGGERGLLGLAFHPDYPSNGRFFVHYSGAEDGDTRLAEYRVSGDPDRADPASARLLLTVEQPAANHNGGMVAFGPDGMLYLGLGDGGGGGDTYGNGQNPDTLLGTILRIDVDGGDPYAIPPDNPFAGGDGGAPEVWAFGLRNPWRFTFDAGLLYIADVGQNAEEEVNVAPADAAGLNYGWPVMEGTACFRQRRCDRSGLTPPVLTYRHRGGVCGVIGGFVYRGRDIPGFQGSFVYGDLCAGWVRGFRYADGQARADREIARGLGRIHSFGHDATGEIYVLSGDGTVRRLVSAG